MHAQDGCFMVPLVVCAACAYSQILSTVSLGCSTSVNSGGSTPPCYGSFPLHGIGSTRLDMAFGVSSWYFAHP